MAILQMPKYPERSVRVPFVGALCFPPFQENAFVAITFELKHLG